MKNRICNYYCPVDSSFISHTIEKITLPANSGKDLYGDLIICGYRRMKTLTIGENSFRNIRHLLIANNRSLSKLHIKESCFSFTVSYEFESIEYKTVMNNRYE